MSSLELKHNLTVYLAAFLYIPQVFAAQYEFTEVISFEDRFFHVNQGSTQPVPVSRLSTPFVQFTGDAFMQMTTEGLANQALHMGTQLWTYQSSNFESSAIRMDFAMPVAAVSFLFESSPDYLDGQEEMEIGSTLKVSTPPVFSIALFDYNGSSVGFFENINDNTIFTGTSSFFSLVLSHVDGLGAIEHINSQCSFDPECDRLIDEVAITGHIWGVGFAPVPEPSTYALMLAGIGLLVSRKRRSFMLSPTPA